MLSLEVFFRAVHLRTYMHVGVLERASASSVNDVHLHVEPVWRGWALCLPRGGRTTASAMCARTSRRALERAPASSARKGGGCGSAAGGHHDEKRKSVSLIETKGDHRNLGLDFRGNHCTVIQNHLM